MCGRYALALRPSEVRQQLQRAQMPVDDAPDDADKMRQSYNFAPGYHGLVYRAAQDEQVASEKITTKYKLQVMQWGLVPSWTKRNPDYVTKFKTINCRDDSLLEDRGMWTTMKKHKRCVIVAQGFFEWLKRNNGKDRLPHFTRHKNGQLMCFAGLWDCVQFEDSTEKLFTYSIITTPSNEQLGFLHDRMPAILENGSGAVRTWLDPTQTEWTEQLQSLLQPFHGSLECYQVSKDVGKVGNDSPSYLVPIDSHNNKNNIANFFGSTRRSTEKEPGQGDTGDKEEKGIKREWSSIANTQDMTHVQPLPKRSKVFLTASPTKKTGTKSATSNGSATRASSKDRGVRRITSFFRHQ